MKSDNRTEKQSDVLKLGFIGGSVKSAVGYAHYVSSRMDNKWSVDAGCFSTDEETNRETASVYGVAQSRVYKNWRDMLEEEAERIDAVLVLTPTPTHYEIVTKCLKSGIPVICEKALARNSLEAGKILSLCNERKGFLAVTYNYSGYPMVRELKSKILGGQLGQILHFQVEMPQEGFIRLDGEGNIPSPQTWRLADDEIPTIYLDLGVHLHQMIHYLTGQKPLEVVGQQGSFGWFKQIVDNVNYLCRYTGGMQGQVWFSKSALGHRNGMKLRVYGSEASAEWCQVNPEELLLSYSDGRRELIDRSAMVRVANEARYNRFKAGHPAGFIEAFSNLYSDIADSLHKYKCQGEWKSSEVYGGELALEGFNLLEAVVSSIESGKWQTVPEVS